MQMNKFVRKRTPTYKKACSLFTIPKVSPIANLPFDPPVTKYLLPDYLIIQFFAPEPKLFRFKEVYCGDNIGIVEKVLYPEAAICIRLSTTQ